MIDFGLSKHFEHGDVLVEQVGTRYTWYVQEHRIYQRDCLFLFLLLANVLILGRQSAPEIFKGSYDFKCDIWAIGVLAYMLLWYVVCSSVFRLRASRLAHNFFV